MLSEDFMNESYFISLQNKLYNKFYNMTNYFLLGNNLDTAIDNSLCNDSYISAFKTQVINLKDIKIDNYVEETIHPEYQRLSLRGKQLEDHNIISYKSIKKDYTTFLVDHYN
ncbi:39108_t:CDS:2, partial [Gigaspora margarita]